jgi:hypothetical protein
VLDNGRTFLEEQVGVKTEKRSESIKKLLEAFTEYNNDTSDLIAFQKALEAYTRTTEAPYHPPQLTNPLNELLGAEQPISGQPKREDVPPPPPRVSKRSIIIDTLAKSNGNGLKVRELLKALPEDAPLKISLEDLYRALPSLKKHGKIWQDKFARYHLGPRPANADSLINEGPQGLLEGSEDLVEEKG